MRKDGGENRVEKKTERGESIKAYFVRLLGKYDVRDEKQFLYIGKWLIFVLLLLVEGLAVLVRLDGFFDKGGWGSFIGLLAVVALLTLSMALHLFAVRGKGKIVFYALDVLFAGGFLFFTGGVYSVIVYMLVLTRIYFEIKRPKNAVLVFVVSILLYIAAYGLQVWIKEGLIIWDLLQLAGRAFGFLLAIATHFVAVQISLAFYRQFLKLDKTLEELETSKKELEKAYAVAKEVSALEERQRIAKDIHDTAGHSITTVIMQTETAKRLMETDPEGAKGKLVAANLQAKHALEELRNSVHLLSGASENTTLKDELEGILHDSSDGTGVNIRSEIEEMEVSPSKRRFLCNTLKEGISNGLRHGKATAFWFELKKEEGNILFLLSDNGKGIDGEWRLGFGLTTMQERARALGGEVFFEWEEGFEIRIILSQDNYGS